MVQSPPRARAPHVGSVPVGPVQEAASSHVSFPPSPFLSQNKKYFLESERPSGLILGVLGAFAGCQAGATSQSGLFFLKCL